MTLDKQIGALILRMLLEARGRPLTEEVLKLGIRTAFRPVAFTEADLNQHFRELEKLEWIGGTTDEISGRIWGLTPAGKIQAQQFNG